MNRWPDLPDDDYPPVTIAKTLAVIALIVTLVVVVAIV